MCLWITLSTTLVATCFSSTCHGHIASLFYRLSFSDKACLLNRYASIRLSLSTLALPEIPTISTILSISLPLILLFDDKVAHDLLVMAPVKDKRGPADSAPEDPGPQRPKTLFKCLSSGLSTILPNISSRRRSLTTRSSDRPKTAPPPSHKHKHRSNRTQRHLPNEEFMVIPQINIPRLSDADSICPYDASTYHSFPIIEDERCSFCGMRPLRRRTPASSASNRPCDHCRSHSPFSHLASPFRRPKRRESSSRATLSDLPTLDEISPLIEDIPRIVPYDMAARRIGNPSRKSLLPVGLRPSYGTSHLSPAHARIPHPHHDHHSHAIPRHSSSSGDSRPISPRLHHIHGLPHAHSHPYVRESEVDAHIAALEAGSPSPLLQVVNEGTSDPGPNQPYRDFSRTVFYGITPASAASSLVIRRVETSARIVVDEGELANARLRLRVEETEIRRTGGGHATTGRTQQRSQSALHKGPSETLPNRPTRPISAPVAEESLTIENGSSNLQLRGGDVIYTLCQTYSSPRVRRYSRIHGSVPTMPTLSPSPLVLDQYSSSLVLTSRFPISHPPAKRRGFLPSPSSPNSLLPRGWNWETTHFDSCMEATEGNEENEWVLGDGCVWNEGGESVE